MSAVIRIPALALAALVASTPLAAQAEAAPTPVGDVSRPSAAASDPLLNPAPAPTNELADRPWLQPFEQERARAEVNRPRWVFPVAGAVIGGAAGLWYHFATQSRSDFMGPIDPVYILGGLGATAGGLTGWYVDLAQRQWIATRPTPKQE